MGDGRDSTSVIVMAQMAGKTSPSPTAENNLGIIPEERRSSKRSVSSASRRSSSRTTSLTPNTKKLRFVQKPPENDPNVASTIASLIRRIRSTEEYQNFLREVVESGDQTSNNEEQTNEPMPLFNGQSDSEGVQILFDSSADEIVVSAASSKRSSIRKTVGRASSESSPKPRKRVSFRDKNGRLALIDVMTPDSDMDATQLAKENSAELGRLPVIHSETDIDTHSDDEFQICSTPQIAEGLLEHNHLTLDVEQEDGITGAGTNTHQRESLSIAGQQRRKTYNVMSFDRPKSMKAAPRRTLQTQKETRAHSMDFLSLDRGDKLSAPILFPFDVKRNTICLGGSKATTPRTVSLVFDQQRSSAMF